MKNTTKISGASVNLTTASVHRLIKPMNKTTQGSCFINICGVLISTDHIAKYTRGVFENDNRFDPIGQTVKTHVR
jgi:hypothetical protein